MGNSSSILLDEPSEGLSPVVVDQLTAAILELKKQGVSVLLSEQKLRFASAVADRAYFIEKGRMRFSANMTELFANQVISKAYLAL
ncbi:MAG: hypothetical protein EXR27_00060 [Betaproteobacteria bacterium]|nr:hypothetical protein [Betaproteobacteria bacterium]